MSERDGPCRRVMVAGGEGRATAAAASNQVLRRRAVRECRGGWRIQLKPRLITVPTALCRLETPAPCVGDLQPSRNETSRRIPIASRCAELRAVGCTPKRRLDFPHSAAHARRWVMCGEAGAFLHGSLCLGWAAPTGCPRDMSRSPCVAVQPIFGFAPSMLCVGRRRPASVHSCPSARLETCARPKLRWPTSFRDRLSHRQVVHQRSIRIGGRAAKFARFIWSHSRPGSGRRVLLTSSGG